MKNTEKNITIIGGDEHTTILPDIENGEYTWDNFIVVVKEKEIIIEFMKSV